MLRIAIAITSLIGLHAWAPSSTSKVGPGPASERPGTIVTVAGDGGSILGGGGPAASAQLGSPAGVAADRGGNLYIADVESHTVRKVDHAGVITTVAGTGEWGYSGDGDPAVAARINEPADLALDAVGSLYIADSGNHRVRRMTGVAGGGPATSAQFSRDR